MEPNTIKDTIQGVVDGLTPLSQKLQVPIENLFGWAIKHNYAVAIAGLSPLVSLMILMPLAIKFGKRANWNSSDFTFDIAACLIFSVLTFIFIIALAMTFNESIQRMIAPEWYASQDISNLIRGK